MSPESLKILYRLITCFQSSGRIGKSLVFEIILAWARFAGIPIAAVDCDAEHRTLSKKFPEAAFVDATRSNDEFLQLIMELPDTPMAIADFPAQATDFLLGAMASLRVLDALDARQTRMTVVMFAADDPTATASLAKTYRALATVLITCSSRTRPDSAAMPSTTRPSRNCSKRTKCPSSNYRPLPRPPFRPSSTPVLRRKST